MNGAEVAGYAFWFLVGLFVVVLGVYFVIAAVLYWRDVRSGR